MQRACGLLTGLLLTQTLASEEGPRRPVEGIMDNSFFIEEAYNQEEGVVQHIFNAVYGVEQVLGPQQEHAIAMSFTQEWPVLSRTHQFSYSVPYNFVWNSGHASEGLGDVLLNYRYQAYYEEKSLTAFAPRFSLVLPTGNRREGFGDGALGYQWNLPFSTTLGDRWFVHANAGLTFLPGAAVASASNLLNYNLGASAIYCVNTRFNLMLEWICNWTEAESDTGGKERRFSSLISPGARCAFNFQNGSQLVLGLGVPIGLTRNAADVGAFLYLSFEHSFLRKKE